MNNSQPGPLGRAVDKAEEAMSKVVGQASARTAGSHDFQAFTINAGISDLYEIEAGRIALEKAATPEVRSLAERLIEDHTRTLAELKQAAAEVRGPVDASPQLDARRKAMLDNLRAVDGEAFEARFLHQQVAAHEEAVRMHHGFAEHGDRPELKAFAARTAPVLEQHLTMVRELEARRGRTT